MPDSNGGGAQPSPSQPKKLMSMETRLLIAFLMMGAVLFLTPYFYKQQQPAPAAKKTDTPAAAAKPQTQAPAAAPAATPAAAHPTPVVPGAISAPTEQTYTVETKVYRVVFSNRGAVVKSWQLKQYKDTKGAIVDLVNGVSAPKTGYPFQILFKDQKPAVNLDQALYSVTPSADGLTLDFQFSDGVTASRKTFEFGQDRYLATIASTVTQHNNTVPHLLAWRGGFGDQTVANPATAGHSLFFNPADNKLTTQEAKAAKDGPVTNYGAYSFAGLEDAYFAAVFLPVTGGSFELRTLNDAFPLDEGGKDVLHVGAAVGGEGANHFRLFAGPKDLDLLKKVDPKLEQVVDWGWFKFLAKPLFLALNWVNDSMVKNFGWAIILVTIAINFLLLPLKITSLQSMKKMQVLQPQIAAINAKYKNVGMRDPRKAEQNQEVMDLYKKHGVNPAGGCVPMLLQIPFFIAFYKVLTVAIELRGASWLWVTDLSQPEHLAIRILPVAMIGTQFVLQKMTPNTSMDPAQQRVMLLMPLMLGFMFYSQSAGLVLYWLTGNLVGILQQMYFNRMAAAPVVETRPTPAKKRSRN